MRAVNDLLEKAVELRASDIHIEPFRSGLVVRMRIDGLLRAVPAPNDAPPQALISRIKILAGLNIAERRLPQDGAARQRVARSDIDIRVATMPTQHGKSAVVRLLPQDRGLLDIVKLGLFVRDEKILTPLQLPHGMIIITGPTGSGKTTTLATMLSLLNQPSRKILTIEDPVEYEIQGVNQSAGEAVRSVSLSPPRCALSLRQDPDVIMVGEVRDAETANIAVHAALTGHLVLTTLHTETAAAAIPRLLDLGVEGFLLKSTLRAVIAQRLVRVLCDRCKTAKTYTHADIRPTTAPRALGLQAGDIVYQPPAASAAAASAIAAAMAFSRMLEMKGEGVRSCRPEHTDAEANHRAPLDAPA